MTSTQSIWGTGSNGAYGANGGNGILPAGAVRSAEALGDGASADVCVIGAGIAGLLVAHRLLGEGKSVIVVDRAGIAAGETGKTTAHLTAVVDSGYRDIASMHGKEAAALVAESHLSAITRLEHVIRNEGIECDFARVDAYSYANASDREALSALEPEREAATDARLVCEIVDSAPLPFRTGPALRFPMQAEVDVQKLVAGLARSIVQRGGLVYAPVRVDAIEKGGPLRVHTTRGPVIEASSVVVATNTPVNDVVTMHTKQAPYRSYAIAAPIPQGSITRALFWDRENPYHYVRTLRLGVPGRSGEQEVVIVGGEDHKVGQEAHAEACWAKLEDWMRARFPKAAAVSHRWSGQVNEPADGLAFIGQNPGDEEIYIVTGQSGNGMTYGAIAALLIGDLVLGRQSPYATLYDPSRKPTALQAIGTFARENLDVARHYGDWLLPGTARTIADIPPGQGGVVRRGLKKIAVYVDEQGRAHERSATCPHLGCVVAWNGAERSWDCPCHGSRFDAYGKLLVGPAVRDLEPVSREPAQPEHGVRR
jgi:glycine/D-amino acid oxidase-like deaminating enzyme/nitrite reductase/ring-hydroxylating ferredoxin subunit